MGILKSLFFTVSLTLSGHLLRGSRIRSLQASLVESNTKSWPVVKHKMYNSIIICYIIIHSLDISWEMSAI